MRKLIFVIAILLIVAGLLGPVVTGRLIEGAVAGDDNPLEQSLPDWLEAVSHDYDRSWFSAGSQLRLVVTDPQRTAMLSNVLDPGQFGDQPAITVTSRVSHGPLVDIITPALARIDSLLFTESSDGRIVQLPLAAQTTLGITGNLRTEWVLAEGGTLTPRGGPPLTWAGASGHFEATASGKAESAVVEVLRIEIGNADGMQRFDDLAVGYVLTRDDTATSLTANFEFDMDAAQSPLNRIAGSVGVDGLPSIVLRNIGPLLRDLVAGGASNLVAVADRHERLIRTALAEPLPMRWRQVAGTEFGDIRIDFDMSLPNEAALGSAPGGANLVSGLVAATTINGRIEMPKAFADAMGATDPTLYEQLTMLRGTGILVPDETGEQLTMLVDYSDGALTVNGAPLPVPLSP